MSDWIEINLPWNGTLSLEFKEYPNDIVDKLVREKFGATSEEAAATFAAKHGKDYFVFISEIERKEINILLKEMGLEYTDQLSGESYSSFYKEIYKRARDVIRNPIMAEIDKLLDFFREINEFVPTIPEAIEFFKEQEENAEKVKEWEQKFSFYSSPLRRAGVLIEVKHTDETVKKYLLGNINCVGGVCNDCVAFGNDAIVLRAKVLIDSSDLE